jgi:predicted ATPase
MAILEGIQIKNFRTLRDVTLGKTFENKNAPLPRLMAVIGANGTGKSSLLDALEFLGDCLQEGVQTACDRPHRGGFERLRTQGAKEPIQFEVRFRQNTDSRPISYSLHINVDRHGRAIVVYERLRQRRQGQSHGQPFSFLEINNGEGTVWDGESSAQTEGNRHIEIKMSDRRVLGIATLGTLADHPRISAFRTFLSEWYLSYFIPQQARSQPMSGAESHLNSNGDNLAKYFQFLQQERPRVLFEQMLARLAQKIPGLTDIKVIEAPDRRLLLAFTAQGHKEPFYQQDMSDGTLKMLAYLSMMEDPSPLPLMGIEEPENGLHHQLLAVLAREFQNFARQSKGPQILITTHSPHFVDALHPEEVWILTKTLQGDSRINRAADDKKIVALYDEGIPMGSLWFSQHLEGAQP